MREISFVKRLKFNFAGSVTKRALVIGDADNDQHNELVCANLQGDLAIFKGRDPSRFAHATDLGMVTACVVGDVINAGKNYVAAINTEGWLFIFDVLAAPRSRVGASESPVEQTRGDTSPDSRSQQKITKDADTSRKLVPLYEQRMPANCKELLLADLDGDGQNEVIIGLTDRVLRTYKWIKIGPDRGKFVGLYKWEFADQIGAVSLNASRHENCQDIVVAQPGGTYAKLECFDKKPPTNSDSSSSHNSSDSQPPQVDDSIATPQATPGNSSSGDNVKTEYINKLTPEYHQLALAQMRNHHISTEVLGGIRDGDDSDSFSLIVIATLDGTLMLVNKDEILWSLQVDHQLFALAVINSTLSAEPVLSQSESTCTIVPNSEYQNFKSKAQQQPEQTPEGLRKSKQYFVVCAWNGKTYIIDGERNYLRFKFDEAVSAFTAGNYYFDGKERASLVYATFNNQIVLYYDVILDQIRPMYLLEEIMNNPDNSSLLKKIELLEQRLNISQTEHLSHPGDNQPTTSLSETKLHNLLQDILYGITDDELNVT